MRQVGRTFLNAAIYQLIKYDGRTKYRMNKGRIDIYIVEWEFVIASCTTRLKIVTDNRPGIGDSKSATCEGCDEPMHFHSLVRASAGRRHEIGNIKGPSPTR